MLKLIYLIIGIIIGIIIERNWAKGRKGNLGAANQAREKSHDETMEKIRQLAKTKSEIANEDVQALLDVSDATATRYLDELVRAGFLKQIGELGPGVKYSIK